MRIRDWRSDVCSSDLERTDNRREQAAALRCQGLLLPDPDARFAAAIDLLSMPPLLPSQARTLLVWGERLLADGRYADARRRLREAAVLFERSEEHTSELPYIIRLSYAVFCLNKQK